MKGSFEKVIKGTRFRFYRMFHVGEAYYDVSFSLNGKKEIFMIVKNDYGSWEIRDGGLPGFVKEAGYQLLKAVEKVENMQNADR